jgi:hypothetical protein
MRMASLILVLTAQKTLWIVGGKIHQSLPIQTSCKAELLVVELDNDTIYKERIRINTIVN